VDPVRIFAEYTGRGDPEPLPALADKLLQQQRQRWPDLARGLDALASIQLRTIRGRRYSTTVQYNPIRMTSTGAKVDPQTISRRKCFLCLENLPEPQQGVLYRGEYLLLCNPAPIFRGHYTVSHTQHRPQAIEESIAMLLSLAHDLSPRYQVFYNGPRCGASAPDHLHFQASPSGSIPLGNWDFLEHHRNGTVSVNGVDIALLANIDRSVLALRAGSPAEAALALEQILSTTKQCLGTSEEPLVNILASWADGLWQVVVILRSKHRPDAYFREDDEKLLISPAAVDMGGLIITPREEDYRRLDARTVEAIYREVSVDPPLAVSILEAIP
jgi:Domain of unknown function (DUF4922)